MGYLPCNEGDLNIESPILSLLLCRLKIITFPLFLYFFVAVHQACGRISWKDNISPSYVTHCNV